MTLNQQSKGRGRRAGAGALALALAAGLWSGPAHAQRGESYALAEELAVSSSPDDGFPGLFDTQLARKGSVVTNLPAAGVYLGLTRELTLGTVLWSYVPLASGLPSGSLHARYRLGSTSWFRSTADVLFFGMRVRDEQRQDAVWAALLGSNTELVLHDAHRLTATALVGHISGSPEDDVAASATAVLLGGSYSLILARWASLQLTGLYLVSGTGEAGGTGMSLDVDWTNGISASDRLVARGLFNFRSGSWLFGVGAARTGSAVTPWLNVAFKVGG
jgi:hypothetical protein